MPARSSSPSRILLPLALAALVVTGAAAWYGARSAARPAPAVVRTDGGAAASASAGEEELAPLARTALDEGNTAFKAGKYDVALSRYRVAAGHAPRSTAPWFGIYMAAKAMGNATLADSAMAVIRRRGGSDTWSDTTLRQLHETKPKA